MPLQLPLTAASDRPATDAAPSAGRQSDNQAAPVSSSAVMMLVQMVVQVRVVVVVQQRYAARGRRGRGRRGRPRARLGTGQVVDGHFGAAAATAAAVGRTTRGRNRTHYRC